MRTVLIICGAFLIAGLPPYIFAWSLHNSQVGQCNRANIATRLPLYNVIRDLEITKEKAAAITTGEMQAQNLAAAERYRVTKEQMIEAVQPVAKEPGSPEVNCEVAFPAPWPF